MESTKFFDTYKLEDKVYLIINTTEYNQDGIASYACATGLDECADFCWDKDETGIDKTSNTIVKVADLLVGQIIESAHYAGAYIMRIG